MQQRAEATSPCAFMMLPYGFAGIPPEKIFLKKQERTSLYIDFYAN